ncbi:MAG: hypothetical protein JNM78_07185 [Cyclobacteriaceae bacterium]|nr:hypothetical protein [Cyclobacteriaceae bacterium]
MQRARVQAQGGASELLDLACITNRPQTFFTVDLIQDLTIKDYVNRKRIKNL